MKKYEAMAGENVSETAKRMVALANKSKQQVQADFNGITLTANPGDKPDAITTFYSNESNRRHEEYVKSPEYKEQQRKAEEAQRRQNLVLEGALSTAPEKMTLRDEATWKQAVEKNSDGYGSGVIRFAERWARLMEGRIANGDTIQGCAEEASHIADNEGITGFMYGAAVSILSQVWVHGEDLRRWHNKSTQLGNEGDEANESGGVLNPALLSIGTK